MGGARPLAGVALRKEDVPIRLSNRLGAVAGFIEKGARVADVGTDHGMLPVFLAENGLARRIVASDVSAASLASALRCAERHRVADRIEFVVAPGLEGVAPGMAVGCLGGAAVSAGGCYEAGAADSNWRERPKTLEDGDFSDASAGAGTGTGAADSPIDTVVIAGVGGETIMEVLAGAPWVRSRGVRLVLQPQTKTDRLCLWLRENGYAILDARLARDSGRLYVVMLAGAGRIGSIGGELPEKELLSKLRDRRDPLFAAFIDSLIAKASRASDGLRRSDSRDLPGMLRKLEELHIFKEGVVCQM